MSQHDFNIANAPGATVRSDLNNALLAILTNNSGSSEPTTTSPRMWWFDEGNLLLKQRNVSDTAWITVGRFDGDGFTPYYQGYPLGLASPSAVQVAETVAEISTAFAALPATGGTIDARGITGTATLSSTLTFDKPVTLLLGDVTLTVNASTWLRLGDDVRIFGNGWGRTILKHGASQAASSTPLIRNDDFTNGNSRIEVAYLTVDGNKANQGAVTDAHGFQVQHCSDLHLHHLEIKDCVGVGIRGYHPKTRTFLRFNRITNCAADDTPRGGIYFARTTTTGGETDTLVVEDNYIDGTGSNSGCVGVAATNSAVVRNISIRRNTLVVEAPVGATVLFGIEVYGEDSPEATITDVSVEENNISSDNSANTYVFGISVAGRGVAGGAIRGNTLRDCGGRSIEAVNGVGVVEGNVEQNCGGMIYDLSTIGGSAKTFTGAAICGNIIDSPLRTDGGLFLKNAATHTALGLLVANNSVRSPAGNGISLQGDFQDGRIVGNTVSDSAGAVAGSHAIVITPNTARPARIQIVENTITDWLTGAGIRLNADDCFVGRNHFQNVDVDRLFTGATGVREPLRIEDVQATTSGTAFDFTGLPALSNHDSAVKRITVILEGVGLSGSDDLLIQIGDSGGIETTGYSSGSNGSSSSTAGFIVQLSGAVNMDGHVVLTKLTTGTWIESHNAYDPDTGFPAIGAGSKTLTGTLDRVRITRTGSDTFNAGQVTILWE